MLSVDEALCQVLAQAHRKPPVLANAADVLGMVLAEDVASDVDSPPYDKSVVDGYAVLAKDLSSGIADLEILEEVTAGDVPRRAVTPGHATRIMTGAPLPDGADAVVMVEQTRVLARAGPLERVHVECKVVASGQNIMRRATSMARGQVILHAGHKIRVAEVGALAEVGRTQVRVVPRPTLAVLSTGNELVNAAERPAAGQIRNSNSPMLAAAANSAGAIPLDLHFARDERESLRGSIARGLECDILVISGGVSAGVLDLVPSVLAELDVRQVFHKVSLKPGKPLWFGVADRDAGSCLVFGLPGNPVSSLVCFELFVRPAIGLLAGRSDASLTETSARLASDFSQRGDRQTYHPAKLSEADTGAAVAPLRWQGSGDLRTLVDANSLACFSPGERLYRAGETVRVLRLPD